MANCLEILGGNMKKAIALMFVIASATVVAMAGTEVPEIGIHPGAVPAALALLGGGLLVVRAYFKR